MNDNDELKTVILYLLALKNMTIDELVKETGAEESKLLDVIFDLLGQKDIDVIGMKEDCIIYGLKV